MLKNIKEHAKSNFIGEALKQACGVFELMDALPHTKWNSFYCASRLMEVEKLLRYSQDLEMIYEAANKDTTTEAIIPQNGVAVSRSSLIYSKRQGQNRCQREVLHSARQNQVQRRISRKFHSS